VELCGREMADEFCLKCPTSCSIQGSFTCRKSTTWDRRLYFPSEGRRAEDFFARKNPTASAGFEPPSAGTKGQHATCRPPKPHQGGMKKAARKLCRLKYSILKTFIVTLSGSRYSMWQIIVFFVLLLSYPDDDQKRWRHARN
jgi:hypothetical protein